VFAIIEAVSKSYPRPHADKHADNLHNARTTIGKWESKEKFTQIGTLQNTAPAVAAALDSVLPNIADQLAETTRQQLLMQIAPLVPTIVAPDAVPDAAPKINFAIPVKIHRRRGKLTELGREVTMLAARCKDSKKNGLAGLLLGYFLDGMSLPEVAAMSTDGLIAVAVSALGRGLPIKFQWQEVLDFISPSLLDFTKSVERVAAAERAFYEARGKRNKSNAKKAAAAEDIKRAQRAWDEEVAKDKGR